MLFMFVLTVAFWLFYAVRILSETGQTYAQLVQFGVSMSDTLLFTHYAAVVMLEIRQLQPYYVVKLVRSPDGAARSYTVGQLSVQHLALHCLDQYYRDFEVYFAYFVYILSVMKVVSFERFVHINKKCISCCKMCLPVI